MQILQRWRNVLILNNTTIQSTRLAAAAKTHLASLHSTSTFFEKWKNKFDSDVRRDQEPSKNCIRYTIKEKRSGAKKDLKGIIYNGGCSTSRDELAADYTDRLNKKSRIKPSHHSKRASHKKLKRKHRRENSIDDHDDDREKAFFAAFGDVGSSWKFRRWETTYERLGNSEWRDSRTEFRDKPFVQGTCADRKILGLPTTGPLQIQDVKAAFRSSALKWHPDRHQGSSQAAAEEKFKHCVEAYKSLSENISSRCR